MRKLLAAATLGAAAALAMTAATLPAAAESLLRFVPHADLAVIDPYWTGAYITRNYGYMVYDTLFAVDSAWQPHPQMVESWTASDDGLVWDFRLRDGLAFHDGQPVRGADVVASLKRWGVRNDSYGQPLLAAASAIEATGERQFRITLKERFPVLQALATLTAPTPFILPERLAQMDPFTQIKDPTGSGPFKMAMSDWQPGHQVVFQRNAAYVPRAEPPAWATGGKQVKLDRVEWQYIPDAATALNALNQGEVDYWENLSNDYVPSLAHDPNVTVSDGTGYIGTVRFNQLYPPFDNMKMRQAVLAVVDQRDYMAAVAGDPVNWRTCASVWACAWQGADPAGGEVLAGPRDFDKARRLIAEAGYKGERIVLVDPTDIPQLHAQALVTNELLKRLGLDVDLATSEWGTAIRRINSRESPAQGGWNVYVTSFAAFDMVNPATNRMLRANGTASPPGWPTDAVLEKLRADWFRAADDQERADIARRIQQRAFEVVPYIPTGEYRARSAYRSDLTGRIEAPLPFLWNIDKGRRG
ncbi:MAG: ABC transporter substrate-binding protein [Alphaproteobacteria bacterium]|nr:ABC transporter substrate-binding protein [Alphaproteobacteria bacterium]